MKLLLIACGGALGSVLRYLVATGTHNWAADAAKKAFGHSLPVGTLSVNLIGCLFAGALAAAFVRNALPLEHYRLALTVGILGGFTTFSAFGLDTFALLERGLSWLAILNIAANCVGGLIAVWAGFRFVEAVIPAIRS